MAPEQQLASDQQHRTAGHRRKTTKSVTARESRSSSATAAGPDAGIACLTPGCNSETTLLRCSTMHAAIAAHTTSNTMADALNRRCFAPDVLTKKLMAMRGNLPTLRAALRRSAEIVAANETPADVRHAQACSMSQIPAAFGSGSSPFSARRSAEHSRRSHRSAQ
jgi:hypothetical protein